MSKLIEKIIVTGTVPAHAPSWAKLNDVQWIQKLDDIVQRPEKYRDSVLKMTLLEEAISMNQIPDFVNRCGKWYAAYPNGREECLGPTGEILKQDGDCDGDTIEDYLRRKLKL